MFINYLQLHQFRCFDSLELAFEKPLIIIEGCNGIGKTSLLEALYFAAYKRSFRTSSYQDLINYTNNNEAFSIKIKGQNSEENDYWDIAIGYSTQKKITKINNELASSSKINNIYKVISLTEDDISIVRGSPLFRRSFIDQCIYLKDSLYLQHVRFYNKILVARNHILETTQDETSYLLWSEQLWKYALIIEQKRCDFLNVLSTIIKEIFPSFLPDVPYFVYKPVYSLSHYESFNHFLSNYSFIKSKEYSARKTLFGPHLHDFDVLFNNKETKYFSSRGMHKLLVILMKIAQVFLLEKKAILLIDDFFLDLDKQRIEYIEEILSTLGIQIFITSPFTSPTLLNFATKAQHINLSI